MAIAHATLATRLGKLFGGLNELNAYRGTTLLARVASLRTAYSADVNELLTGLTDSRIQAQKSLDPFVAYASALVSETIIAGVNDDRVTPFNNIDDALREWVRQLINDGQTFNDAPYTCTTAAVGAPTADITFVSTVKDGFGVAGNFGVPDRYLHTVVADADRGGTRWAETLSLVGKAADDSVTDASYPTGLGINTTFQVIDPQRSGGLITDGSFNSYTSGNFAQWTRGAGLTTADVFRAAEDYRDGVIGFALALTSNGAVSLAFQDVDAVANTVYFLNFAVKCVNATMATAKVHVSLRRLDTGAEVADAAGTVNRVSSSTMGTIGVGNWVRFTGVMITPSYIPTAGLYLDIRLADGTTVTTTATANTAAYVDHVSLVAVEPMYQGGPRLAAFSGKIAPLVTDQWQTTVALTAGTIGSYMVRWLDRTIGLSGRDFTVPTIAGGGETILDSLIS